MQLHSAIRVLNYAGQQFLALLATLSWRSPWLDGHTFTCQWRVVFDSCVWSQHVVDLLTCMPGRNLWLANLPAISIWMLPKCFKDLGTRTNFRNRWKSCNVGSSARFPPKLSASKGKTRGVFDLTCSISIFFEKRQIWSSVSSSIAFDVATVFPSLTNCCNWQKSTTSMAFFQGSEAV